MTDPPHSHISPRVHSYGNLLKVQPRSAAAHGTSEHEVTQAHLLWLQSLQPANPRTHKPTAHFFFTLGLPSCQDAPPITQPLSHHSSAPAGSHGYTPLAIMLALIAQWLLPDMPSHPVPKVTQGFLTCKTILAGKADKQLHFAGS